VRVVVECKYKRYNKMDGMEGWIGWIEGRGMGEMK